MPVLTLGGLLESMVKTNQCNLEAFSVGCGIGVEKLGER